MKIRLHLLTIILTLGFFLLPKVNYACTTKSEKSCCKKQEQAKSEKKDCCKNKKSTKNNNCGGKCGHSNCTTPVINLTILLQNHIEFKIDNYSISLEKHKINYTQIHPTSGYVTIWSPPNIG